MRSIGGTNDRSNLVNLTLKEHYFVHELLVKIYTGTQYENSAIKAWNGMSRKMPNHIKSSRLYMFFRSRYNKVASQSTSGKICITNGHCNRYIYPNEPIPNGFYKGMHRSKKGLENIQKGSSNRIGMIIVNDGKRNKWVWPYEIPKGFVIGGAHQANKGKIVVNDGHRQIMVYPDKIPNGFKIGSLPIMSEKRRQAMKIVHATMSDEKKRKRNRKISQKNKGRKPWTTGKHLSVEHRMAISKGNKNKKLTIEQREQISNRQRGKIKVNNGIKTIYADPNNIPLGYVRGQLRKNH